MTERRPGQPIRGTPVAPVTPAPRQHAPERSCEGDGCEVVLSRYNPGVLCATCEKKVLSDPLGTLDARTGRPRR